MRLLVLLILVRPALLLRWPVHLVVVDQPLDVQLAEQLRRKPSRRQIFDLALQLALLADDRVDASETRAPQQDLQPPAQRLQRLLHQLPRSARPIRAARRWPSPWCRLRVASRRARA